MGDAASTLDCESARALGERFLVSHPESASARRVTLTLRTLASSNDAAPLPPPAE